MDLLRRACRPARQVVVQRQLGARQLDLVAPVVAEAEEQSAWGDAAGCSRERAGKLKVWGLPGIGEFLFFKNLKTKNLNKNNLVHVFIFVKTSKHIDPNHTRTFVYYILGHILY